MTTEKRKASNGDIEIVRNGQVTDIIHKTKKGYDKYIITAAGKVWLPPSFSHFSTLKQALKFCGVE